MYIELVKLMTSKSHINCSKVKLMTDDTYQLLGGQTDDVACMHDATPNLTFAVIVRHMIKLWSVKLVFETNKNKTNCSF